MLPEDKRSNPPIQRNSVDLPQPDAPTKVMNSLFGNFKVNVLQRSHAALTMTKNFVRAMNANFMQADDEIHF